MRPSWRSRAITGVALFLEGCTLFLIVGTVTQVTKLDELKMSFWLVIASLCWGYLLSHWILNLALTPVLRGVIGLAVGIPTLLVLVAWNAGETFWPFGLLFPPQPSGIGLFIGSVIFLLIIWWRGVELSREETTLDSVRSAFQIGMVTLLIVALIDAILPGRLVSGFLVLGFFAVGLPGMALARFSADGGEQREMPRQWIWPILACVGGVLALGLLISALGLGGLDDVSRAVFGFVGKVGLEILEPVLMLIGFLAGALVNLGNWLSGIFGGGDIDGLLEAQRRIDQFHNSLRELESESDGNVLFTVLKWVAALLGAMAAGGVIYWLFRNRRYRGGDGEVVETRESLFSLKRAGEDVSGAIGGLFPGWLGRRRRSRTYLSPRDYYHALLDQAGRAGRPKEEWETPREHQRGLSGVLPADPVAHIVDEFQAAHYGAAASNPEQLQRLEQDRIALEEFLREPDNKG